MSFPDSQPQSMDESWGSESEIDFKRLVLSGSGGHDTHAQAPVSAFSSPTSSPLPKQLQSQQPAASPQHDFARAGAGNEDYFIQTNLPPAAPNSDFWGGTAFSPALSSAPTPQSAFGLGFLTSPPASPTVQPLSPNPNHNARASPLPLQPASAAQLFPSAFATAAAGSKSPTLGSGDGGESAFAGQLPFAAFTDFDALQRYQAEQQQQQLAHVNAHYAQRQQAQMYQQQLQQQLQQQQQQQQQQLHQQQRAFSPRHDYAAAHAGSRGTSPLPLALPSAALAAQAGRNDAAAPASPQQPLSAFLPLFEPQSPGGGGVFASSHQQFALSTPASPLLSHQLPPQQEQQQQQYQRHLHTAQPRQLQFEQSASLATAQLQQLQLQQEQQRSPQPAQRSPVRAQAGLEIEGVKEEYYKVANGHTLKTRPYKGVSYYAPIRVIVHAPRQQRGAAAAQLPQPKAAVFSATFSDDSAGAAPIAVRPLGELPLRLLSDSGDLPEGAIAFSVPLDTLSFPSEMSHAGVNRFLLRVTLGDTTLERQFLVSAHSTLQNRLKRSGGAALTPDKPAAAAAGVAAIASSGGTRKPRASKKSVAATPSPPDGNSGGSTSSRRSTGRRRTPARKPSGGDADEEDDG